MLRLYKKYEGRAMKYFGKYPNYNALIHVIGGIGIGFLLTYPLAGSHPIRWGVAFIILSIVGHWWAGR